jgi:MarR family transcriptional regulator, lower aerobic nicotinate degradation pathway regulator
MSDPDFRGLPTWLLSQAAQQSHRVLHQRLAEAGATGYEYRLLSSLDACGACTQAELGRLAMLDRRDVAVTVGSLVKAGSLGRRSDPADARIRVVSLTAAGRTRHKELAQLLEGVQREVFGALAADERERLVEYLKRLA